MKRYSFKDYAMLAAFGAWMAWFSLTALHDPSALGRWLGIGMVSFLVLIVGAAFWNERTLVPALQQVEREFGVRLWDADKDRFVRDGITKAEYNAVWFAFALAGPLVGKAVARWAARRARRRTG